MGDLCTWEMEPQMVPSLIKYEVTKGRGRCTKSFPGSYTGQRRKDPIRQRHDGDIHKQARRNKIPKLDEPNGNNSVKGRNKHQINIGHPPERDRQYTSRFFKSKDYKKDRLVTKSSNLLADHTNMGCARGRSVCLKGKRKTTNVLFFTGSHRWQQQSRCVQPKLGLPAVLCLASNCTNPLE